MRTPANQTVGNGQSLRFVAVPHLIVPQPDPGDRIVLGPLREHLAPARDAFLREELYWTSKGTKWQTRTNISISQ
jgi:hypothetical protein